MFAALRAAKRRLREAWDEDTRKLEARKVRFLKMLVAQILEGIPRRELLEDEVIDTEPLAYAKVRRTLGAGDFTSYQVCIGNQWLPVSLERIKEDFIRVEYVEAP